MSDILAPVGEQIGKGIARSLLFHTLVFLISGVVISYCLNSLIESSLKKKSKFQELFIKVIAFIAGGSIFLLFGNYIVMNYGDPSFSFMSFLIH